MDFKPGQKVVYPNHGIAVIENIESRDINGEKSEYILLRVQENNSLVMVPLKNAEGIGLRRTLPARQCEQLLEMLSDNFEPPPVDWKNRFKGFTDKMRSGDLFAIADVLKTLTYIRNQQSKPLSFREKQMLERARYLVISELTCVSRRAEAGIVTKVDEALLGACEKHTRVYTRNAGAA